MSKVYLLFFFFFFATQLLFLLVGSSADARRLDELKRREFFGSGRVSALNNNPDKRRNKKMSSVGFANSCTSACPAYICPNHNCTDSSPYLCILPTMNQACYAEPPTDSAMCTGGCCDVRACSAATCGPCTMSECESATRCPDTDPYECTRPMSMYESCSADESTWTVPGNPCTRCCDTAQCGLPPATTAAPTLATTAAPSPPPASTAAPPTPTPTPETTTKTPAPTTAAPTTALPPAPTSHTNVLTATTTQASGPASPSPASLYPDCTPGQCHLFPAPCPLSDPITCLPDGGELCPGACLPNTLPLAACCKLACNTNACRVTNAPPAIPMCTAEQCLNFTACPDAAPVKCIAGPKCPGACLPAAPPLSPCCSAACNTMSCPRPTQAPHPPHPSDLVPPSENCTYTGPPYGSPPSNATPYGAIDVSQLGCKAWVAKSCCGYTPRFNWILSTCSLDPAKRLSMACRHPGSNITALQLRYVAAYQWDGSKWNKDPQSSTPVHPNGDLDLTPYRDGGAETELSDWDKKYAPTTQEQHTAGLGPPAFMFVLSAKHLAYAAFFALNQLTLNRGPEAGENCWGSSSGELDFLEVPFWANVELPMNRWYLTTTANAGRCLPSQKNVPSLLGAQCSNSYCCEMCSCPNGTACFGNESDIGYQPMGCINNSLPDPKRYVPPGAKVFTVDGDNETCGRHFGAAAGGAASNAYFEQVPGQGDKDVMFAVVVDHDGTFVYRWHASQSNRVWPELQANHSPNTVHQRRPTDGAMRFGPPCPPLFGPGSPPCGLWEPSCTGDCPLVSAAGNFGLGELSGMYSAEASRDGLNWWDYFQSTQLDSSDPKRRKKKMMMNAKGDAAAASAADAMISNSQKTKNKKKKKHQQYLSSAFNDELLSPKHIPRNEKITIIHPKPPFNCSHKCPTNLSTTVCPYDYPFECIVGDAVGGCSNSQAIWQWGGHCKACCDQRMNDIVCGACPASKCLPIPTCPPVAPYLCSAGASAGGCAPNATFWERDPASCTSCCKCPNE